AGPPGLCIRRWRAWAASRGRAVSMPEELGPHGAVSVWITALIANRDLVDDAINWLAAIAARDSNELRCPIGASSLHHFILLLDTLPLDATRDPVAPACRGVLACRVVQAPLSAARLLEQVAATSPAEPDILWTSMLAGLAGMVTSTALPGILYAPQAASEV